MDHEAWLKRGLMGADEDMKEAYQYFMRPDPDMRDFVGPIEEGEDALTGRVMRSRLARVGMLRNADDSAKREVRVYLNPLPHIRLDRAKPLQGWYQSKFNEKGNSRDRPCLLPDTQVNTPFGYKRIADLKPGDIIFGLNETTGVICQTTVEGTLVQEKPSYLEVELMNGRVLKLTPEHLVKTKVRGWVEAQTLTEADDIVDIGLRHNCGANERLCGVYGLINEVDGKLYVGSSMDIVARVKRHFRRLETKAHTNSHLQAAYNLGHRFRPVVIELCRKERLIEREQFQIDLHGTASNIKGYNLTVAGRTIPTADGRARISKSKLGKTWEQLYGPKVAAKLKSKLRQQTGPRNPNYGNRGSSHPNFGVTEVERFGAEKAAQLAMDRSVRLKGCKRSRATKAKISEARKGKPLSLEHRASISAGLRRSLRQRVVATETRAKISRALKRLYRKHPELHPRRKPPKLCKRCGVDTPRRSCNYCSECRYTHISEIMLGNKRGCVQHKAGVGVL